MQLLLLLLLSPAVFSSSDFKLPPSMLGELELEDEQSPLLNKVFGDARSSLVLRSQAFGAAYVHGTFCTAMLYDLLLVLCGRVRIVFMLV